MQPKEWYLRLSTRLHMHSNTYALGMYVYMCAYAHTHRNTHIHNHTYIYPWCSHTKRTPKSQLALCMHVHDTETHNVAMSSDSHLALTCWEMAHTMLILVCRLSNLSFLPICLPGSFPCAAVEQETRKGVSDTRVCWLLRWLAGALGYNRFDFTKTEHSFIHV